MALNDLLAEIFGPLPGWLLPAGVVLSLISIKKLELAPWRWLADWCKRKAEALGRFLCAAVISQMDEMAGQIATLSDELHNHILDADKREADGWRASILHFNVEIMDGCHLQREDYIEALAIIDDYEAYCRDHPDYKNNRAVAAVRNIKRSYDARMIAGFKEDT